MNGLFGLNTRTLGVSRDQILSAQRQIGGAFLLSQDDPTLIVQARAAGILTIYRQSGDEGDALSQDPVVFVQTRAEKGADYVYLTNEVTSSDALHQWTRRAIDTATAIGVKLVLYNYGTNAPRLQWEAALPNLRYAVERGHAVGVHCYFDGTHDAGAYGWLDIKHLIGGLWLVTEFGSIRDIADAYHGWRGRLSPAQYGDFMRGYGARFQDEQMPVLIFSGDQWPSSDEGKASGFGVLDNAEVIAEIVKVNSLYQWKGVPVPAPTYPEGSNPASKVLDVSAGLKLRTAPSLSGVLVRVMAYRETVTVYEAPVIPMDGYSWLRVTDSKGLVGWAANAVEGKPSWVDPAMNEVWTVNLDVPYVSQIDGSSTLSNNDCGIASLLMLERYWLEQHGLSTPLIPSVDDVVRRSPLVKPNPPNGLTFAQIQQLALLTGFQTHYEQPMTEAKLIGYLDAKTPIAVLLDYSVFNPLSKPLAHILVVYGFSETSFLTHDPYQLGQEISVLRSTLMKAIQSSPGNSIPFQGMVLVG